MELCNHHSVIRFMATDMKAATALTLLIPYSISHSAELMTNASQGIFY